MALSINGGDAEDKTMFFRLISIPGICLIAGCSNGGSPAEREQVLIRTAPKSENVPQAQELKMPSGDQHPWRSDPQLAGKFLDEFPDDLQVLVHDGGPRFTERAPELVWVTVTGSRGRAYRGKVLNQPHELKTVRQDQEILFLAAPSAEHPVMVTAKYLAERDTWVIEPCNKCEFAELFDTPSDLIVKVFPQMAAAQRQQLQVFTSFCPLCRGVQLVRRPGVELE